MSAEEKPRPRSRRRGRIGNKITGTRGNAAAAVISSKDGRVYREGYSAPRRDLEAEAEVVYAIDPVEMQTLVEDMVKNGQGIKHADDVQVRSAAERLLKKRMGLMTALAHR